MAVRDPRNRDPESPQRRGCDAAAPRAGDACRRRDITGRSHARVSVGEEAKSIAHCNVRNTARRAVEPAAPRFDRVEHE